LRRETKTRSKGEDGVVERNNDGEKLKVSNRKVSLKEERFFQSLNQIGRQFDILIQEKFSNLILSL